MLFYLIWLSLVTEENVSFETTVWPTLFLFNVFTAVKGTQFHIFLLDFIMFYSSTGHILSGNISNTNMPKIDDFVSVKFLFGWLKYQIVLLQTFEH